MLIAYNFIIYKFHAEIFGNQTILVISFGKLDIPRAEFILRLGEWFLMVVGIVLDKQIFGLKQLQISKR